MSSPNSSLCLDRPQGQSLAHDSGQALHRVGCAAGSLADTSRVTLHSIQAGLLDPFAYHKAFHDTNAPSGRSASEVTHVNDGYAYHIGSIGAQNIHGVVAQQVRARALRFTDRTNGAPLATIVEQGSYSTLNSRGSLLSVGRLPTLSIAESHSLNRPSHKGIHRLDENRLYRKPEGTLLEEDHASALRVHTTLQDCRQSHAPVGMATPVTLSPDLPQSPQSKIDDADQYANDCKTQGFLCGVLQNVRTASRTRSRSSSWAHPSVQEARERLPETSGKQTIHQVRDTHDPRACMGQDSCPQNCKASLSMESLSSFTTPSSVGQTRSRKTSLTSDQPHESTTFHLPLSEPFSHPLEHPSAVQTIPHLLPLSATVISLDQPSSVHTVPPEPRDVAAVGVAAQAAAFSTGHSDSTSIQLPCYGVATRSCSAASLVKNDRGKDMSRNASFCSTLSTSYSGTVLGVDLDLQYEELERLACASESPKNMQPVGLHDTSHSITSSALTSLLPIAAASGIVQPNYNTPKISFYSPSGKMIQQEGSSSPDTRKSPAASLATASSQHNSSKQPQASHHLRTTCLLPLRPLLVPMTTPPATVAPLPYHLRHHHNYQHPERSFIYSCESLIDPSPSIKGCGGIVRNPSLSLRGGILNPPSHRTNVKPQRKPRRSLHSYLHDLRSDAGFYKSRYIALAQNIGPSSQNKSKKKRPKTLHKQHMTSKRTVAASHYMSVDRKRSSPDQNRKGSVGPLAGHVLRICFCQPYDGAGNRTRTDTSCTRRHADGMHGVDHEDEDLQTEHEGAVRPVSGPRQAKEAGRRSTTCRSRGRIENQHVVLKRNAHGTNAETANGKHGTCSLPVG
ncbi:hypothetical protein DE146DRAFT_763746 [Phaeosphaeria sp. MPI-PUGE-AT-0046c]|nr:hypothetical protein DE146DRAFT_763746 [Phaeosphaeria sp. MPI-PUGE-AT-0046c]